MPQTPTTDELRARELYRYFRPPHQDGGTPDPTLTAHAQLVAWRLNAERSMITLIDEQTQYFVAESTKTLSLDNAHEHENADDAIWAGCVRVSKAGRLCEHTIAAELPGSGGPACFEVLDLSEDIRFNSLDFIAGPPYFKNYAGVPLRSRNGINIGSIFVIDSRIRPALTASERNFLGVVADNVVKHLEMLKDQKDCQRSLNMNACVSAYIDPLHSFTGGEVDDEFAGKDLPQDSKRTKNSFIQTAPTSERSSTFRRAADLILKGLDFDEMGGGVMILDTQPSGTGNHSSATASSSHESEEESGEPVDIDDVGSSQSQASERNREILGTDVLAHAYQSNADASTISDQSSGENMPPKFLSSLIKHYRHGKLFTFTAQGRFIASSSDDSANLLQPAQAVRQQNKTTSKSYARKVLQYFPAARQVLFLPIWDTSTSRWAVCIAYHGSKFRDLSYKSEFVFCATFGNAIVGELAKLASLQSSQQKSNFMASISHELRSPLHGILASCEFLDETVLTELQKSLLGTADSCARTLLDTINMVLDYSNINTFEDTKGRSNRDERNNSQDLRSKVLQTNLIKNEVVDVAGLLEEVVEVLAVGHNFGHRSKRGNPTSYTVPDAAELSSRLATRSLFRSDAVEIILDIATNDWVHCVESGPLRRIIMNIVGNALKFTTSGFVYINLEMSKSKRKKKILSNLVLTVTDTGPGISQTYMRDSIFVPFSQESELTSGTGLGLPLVKTIVQSMGGKIYLDSNIGIGTKVTVKLPVYPAPVRSDADSPGLTGAAHDINASPCEKSNFISAIQTQARERTGALYWPQARFTSSTHSEGLRRLQRSLVTYLSRWLGLSICIWEENCVYDIVISTVEELNGLAKLDPTLFTPDHPITFLAIGSTASFGSSVVQTLDYENVIVLPCPFGPFKLAQAVKRCLDRSTTPNCTISKENSGSSIRAIHNELPNTLCGISPPTEAPVMNGTDAKAPQIQEEYSETDRPKDQTDSLPTASLISHIAVEVAAADSNENEKPSAQSLPEISRLHIATVDTKEISTQTLELDIVKLATTTSISDRAQDRMLLVDDNDINLRLLQVYVKKLGHIDAHSAENGQIAVDTYERLLHSNPSIPPDVILMDLSMPVMNGFEATRQIRKIEANYNKSLAHHGAPPLHCLIIALTGLASVKDQREAFAAGVDQYTMKPVKFKKLSLELARWKTKSKDELV